MTIQHITILDDLLRTDYLPARTFIYALIEEPIRQAANAALPDLRNYPKKRGLREGFDLDIFRSHCGHRNWVSLYHDIPPDGKSYLVSYIRAGTQVIGYEMPPWLIKVLDEYKISWIDIRISPIRFSRDLYLVLRKSVQLASTHSLSGQVTEEEIRIEAGLMRASILHNQRYKRHAHKKVEAKTLFLGQTSEDASIISEHGQILSVNDYKEEILDVVGRGNVLYKPHPYGDKRTTRENSALHSILGKRVQTTKENIYDLLAGDLEFDVVSISSGALQEAEFFGRTSHTLFRPICELNDKATLHVRFLDFASPLFWADIFGQESKHLKVRELPYVPENLMRRLHSTWWGYSEYMVRNDDFWRQAFTHGLKSSIAERVKRMARFLPNILTK